jgi:hypothetical protein
MLLHLLSGYGVQSQNLTKSKVYRPLVPNFGEGFLKSPRIGGFRGLDRLKRRQLYLYVNGSLSGEGARSMQSQNRKFYLLAKGDGDFPLRYVKIKP